MATRIRILPDEVVNRIAAGEAVERPASVVKELVENAIDAGSDRIVVEIAAGGKEAIRVTDNGCGMSRDDGLLALERHATSKISGVDDLAALCTLGFRGEALPSIAAVSRMVLESRPEGDPEGTRIVVEGGRVRDASPVGRDTGTTVAVHGLFFNVPARKKFLKSVETELRHVVATVTGLALANPERSFVLTHGGRTVLNQPRADRRARTASILGVRMGEDGVFMESDCPGVQVWGFVGRPDLARRSGAQQAQVVNGRWVQHKGLSYAVYDGYGGMLQKGLYPSFALFLQVDPARVDVNVHPSKREVRFSDGGRIYRVVAEAVRSALRKADIVPQVGGNGTGPVTASLGGAAVSDDAAAYEPQPDGSISRAADASEGGNPKHPPGPTGLQMGPQIALSLPVRDSQGEGERPEGDRIRGSDLLQGEKGEVPVWQLHRRYVLAPVKSGMIAIDQQLAHQRIIYELVMSCFSATPGSGQRLLFPLTVDLGLGDVELVRRAIPFLERMGFGIRDFGGNTVVIDAIPQDMTDWQDGQLFREIVGDLSETEKASGETPSDDESRSPLEHTLAASYARHTAVGRDVTLSTREMQALIDQLFGTREPFVSPAGRPTVARISLDEIDRRFGR